MNTINMMPLNTGAAIVIDYASKCPESGWRVADCRCQTHRPDLHWGLNTTAANPTRFVVSA